MKRKQSPSDLEDSTKHKLPHLEKKKTPSDQVVHPGQSKTKQKKKLWRAKHGTVYISSKKNVPKPNLEQTANNGVTAKTNHTGTSEPKGKIGKCMKHKRKDKQLPKQTTMEKTLSNSAKGTIGIAPVLLPKSSNDISANWKQLIKSDTSLRKKQHKKSHRERHHIEDMGKECKPAETKSEPDIWFDDVDEVLLDTHWPKLACQVPKATSSKKGDSEIRGKGEKTVKTNPLVKPQSFEGLTKALAMDCEMVGIGDGGKDSILARVSIVNQFGQCVYDKHVKPTERVTDYRTHVSGIRRKDIDKGENFSVVQQEVSDMIKDRILVGHALQNDFKVLYLSHPKKKIRDTARYRPFVALFNGRRPSLKKLTEKVLAVAVQEGEHDSVQDAQAAMRLYTMYRKQWEKELKEKFKKTTKSRPVKTLE